MTVGYRHGMRAGQRIDPSHLGGLEELGLNHLIRPDQFIKDRELNDVLGEANILKRSKGPVDLDNVWPAFEGDTTTLQRHETLRTSQGYLHRPTLAKYIVEGAPEMDPDYPGEEVPYHPDVFSFGDRGNQWIDEGHHRITASRLRGDSSLTANLGHAGWDKPWRKPPTTPASPVPGTGRGVSL
jgi:hypothetical protein